MSTYPTLDGLPSAEREALSSVLEDDEAFLGGIECRDAFLLGSRRATRLFLTDRRVVEYRRGLLRSRAVDYDREQVTTASVSMGLLFHQLVLAGPGLRHTFRVNPAPGRQFVDALRSDDRPRIDEAGRFQRVMDDRPSYAEDDDEFDPSAVDHWSRWHYVVVLAAVTALVGAATGSLALLATGYVAIPITTYLDIRYVQASDLRWQPDVGLYLVGGIIFPLIAVPMYLYRRHETIGL